MLSFSAALKKLYVCVWRQRRCGIGTRNVADCCTSLSLTSLFTYHIVPSFCSGTISTASLLDRLLGRLSALFRGELIDGIADHGSNEYIRHFQQVVINARVPLLEKAISTFNDAVGELLLKVGVVVWLFDSSSCGMCVCVCVCVCAVCSSCAPAAVCWRSFPLLLSRPCAPVLDRWR